MRRRPPRSKRTYTRFPYTTLFRSQQPGLGRRRPRPVARPRWARGLRTAADGAARTAAAPTRGVHAARAGGVRRRRHGADHEMQRGLGEDAPVARPGRAATATGGFRMNHDNRDARFDAAMRQLHESAVDRVSGRTRLQLQQAPDRNSAEHTSELQSLMRISYAVFCLKKKRRSQSSPYPG